MRYMNLWERRGYDRGIATGITTGGHNHAIESALRMLKRGYKPEDIEFALDLPLAEVEELARRYRSGELVPA